MGSTSRSTNGSRDGGVDAIPANQRDRDSYEQAGNALAEMRVPILVDSNNPHERLFVAGLDGTGNSMINDERENWSAVAKIYDQIERAKLPNIAAGYVEGTFTQEGTLRTPERLADGMFGHSFDERVETAYFQLCKQVKEWLAEDPEAQIRVAGVGFSRGAEQTAALLRMIDERGIRDPDGANVKLDRDGIIQKVEYADKPLLVEPGKTLQAALLFDPVSTGVQDEDRRLPGATLSTLQITADDERRDPFRANDHVPPGYSEDRRNLNVTVPGAHSDVGDTYTRNGLGTLSFNLGVEFLNRLSDRAFLQKRDVPDDPSQFVIHRSDQHMYGLHSTRGYDRDGVRDRVQDQSPQPGIQHKDPINPELDRQVERRTAPNLTGPAERAPPADNVDALFDRLSRGAMQGDDKAMSGAVVDYLRSPPGQQFQADTLQLRQAMETQERQASLEQQLLAQQQEAARSPHVMRM